MEGPWTEEGRRAKRNQYLKAFALKNSSVFFGKYNQNEANEISPLELNPYSRHAPIDTYCLTGNPIIF